MNAASWATLSTGEFTTNTLLADIVQNMSTPKSPTATQPPTMPAAQSPILDNVIGAATGTAKLIGSNIVNAAITKAFTPTASTLPRSKITDTGMDSGGLGIIAGALAVAGLLVYTAV